MLHQLSYIDQQSKNFPELIEIKRAFGNPEMSKLEHQNEFNDTFYDSVLSQTPKQFKLVGPYSSIVKH